jgi:hypothetical protein
MPLVACGVGLLGSTAHAQVTRTGDSYQLRVKYRKGMELHYLTQTAVTMPSNTTHAPSKPLTVAEPMAATVTDVRSGIATLKVTLGPATMNGQQQGAARDFEIKVDEHARPVGAPVSGLEFLLPDLPDRVRVGQTFARKQSGIFMQIPVTLNATYRFQGVKSVNGQSYALFQITLSGTGNLPVGQAGSAPFQTGGTGTMQVAVADGLIAHVSVDQTGTLSQGSHPLHVKFKTVIDRK